MSADRIFPIPDRCFRRCEACTLANSVGLQSIVSNILEAITSIYSPCQSFPATNVSHSCSAGGYAWTFHSTYVS